MGRKRKPVHRRRAGGGARRSPAARALTAIALVLVLAGVGAVGWLLLIYPHRPGPGDAGERILEVAPGTSARGLAQQLEAEGVVSSGWLFAAYLRILGVDSKVRHGRILVSGVMSPAELAVQVVQGRGPARHRFTVPEGFTRFDIADRLEGMGLADREAFLAETERPDLLLNRGIGASVDGIDSLEGYLFPDTYEVIEGAPPEDIVRKMLRNFDRRVGPLLEAHAEGRDALAGRHGWDVHDIVTLASVVEKEAGVAEERSVIAGVFLNRLTSDAFTLKRLQADPTVSYGCLAAPDISEACRSWGGGAITRAMLDDLANPYNTYRHDLLPPGPIANPGLDAIRAVLDPATHDYFYFVAKGGGRHVFSETLQEHNAAIRRHLRSGEP